VVWRKHGYNVCMGHPRPLGLFAPVFAVMKNFTKTTFAIFAFALILTACTPDGESYNTLVISDTFFRTQVTGVFINAREYMGRTVQFEGLFRTVDWFPSPHDGFVVHRYLMSCCGRDPIGFEVFLPDGMAPFADQTWVEVTGVLEQSHGFPAVRAESIIEKAEQGRVFVWR